VDGNTLSRKDALNSAAMNNDSSPADRLTNHVGSVLGQVCRFCLPR